MGVGALATADVAPPLAIDIGLEAYVESPDGHGGDVVMVAGMQLKHVIGRNAVFLKLLPGAIWFRGAFLTSRNLGLSVRPAVDVGIGFERATGDRLALRFDLTDTMLLFGNDQVFTGTPVPIRPGLTHCPGLGLGITVRL